MGGATEKDWPKRPSDHQLQEAREKDSDRAITHAKAVHVPAHQHRQGPHKPSSWATFMLNSHWGRAATGKKSLASMHTGSLWLCPTLCSPVDCGLPGFSVREAGGILQARILECISQYWLPYPLEHYISCCPRHQLPWVPGAARTPATQAAAPPPHLTGANPSHPGQPQEQTPVDGPHAEVEIKLQLKPRGSVAKEEDPKPPRQLYKLQIKSRWSTRQTLCLLNI